LSTEEFGKTIPAVGVPFGMTQWTPQTRLTEQKCQAPYYYADTVINGFRATHWISGSCMQDYGSFSIMTTTGSLQTSVSAYQTTYEHANEKATPAAYSVMLKQYHLTVKLTATARCGLLQVTALRDDTLNILLTPNSDKGRGYVKINSRNEVESYNPAHRIYQGWGQPAGFSSYLVMQVDKTPAQKGVYVNSTVLSADSIAGRPDIGAYVRLLVKRGEVITVKCGTSFTSLEEARKNLAVETGVKSFNEVESSTAAIWEAALRKITVEGRSEKDKRIFYTAMYHAMQHPRLVSDVSGRYPMFSADYKTATAGQGQYFDDFSQWDIYRAQLPLLTIIEPQKVNSFIQSMLLKGRQGGWLPIFPCWNNYTAAMVGDHVIPFIAGSYNKGIRNFDVKEAYRLMRKNAFETPAIHDYENGKGRRALTSYLKYGYIPLEDTVPFAFHKKEQVSRTMEYAFDDYALAEMAKALHQKEDYAVLSRRAKNYRNVFDKKTGFVNGRYADGSFIKDFNPDVRIPLSDPGINFITEGNPRQYTFYVPHDIAGLAQLMGGKKGLEQQLDSLFLKQQYWHGNEPGHQIPFMYNYTNAPWKTQQAVHHILMSEYSDGPGGLSGNDDAGQMSAWYIMAAVGLYPVNPVSDEYAITAPLFNKITIRTAENKKMLITCNKESENSIYIKSVLLNGKPYRKSVFHHKDLVNGAVIQFELCDKPAKPFMP
jgi:predicted alpha-1,2-mannosidase